MNWEVAGSTPAMVTKENIMEYYMKKCECCSGNGEYFDTKKKKLVRCECCNGEGSIPETVINK